MDTLEFKPSAETELLCADLPNDANGRVMKHLLKQVDVGAQQNRHIINEQVAASVERVRMMDSILTKSEFQKHEELDAAVAEKVAQIERTVSSFARFRIVIQERWKMGMALCVAFLTVAGYGVKVWVEDLLKK